MPRLTYGGHLLGYRAPGGSIVHYTTSTTTPPPDPDPPAENTVTDTVTETV